MKNVIIDQRMRNFEKDFLIKSGYNLIEISKSNNVYEEISSHIDIFFLKIENNLIIEDSRYQDFIENRKQRDEKINIYKGNSKVFAKYPEDVKYNVCIIGKNAIHNFKYTDSKILEILKEKEYNLIDINQGYSNCSIAVIDEKSFITCDKGIYEKLQNKGFNILFLEEAPDIKLLKGNIYSEKKGFIGGAISKIGQKIIINGDLSKIDINKRITNFIKERNIEIIDFKGHDIIDYGGIIEF